MFAMKATYRLCGLCVGMVLSLAFGASAFANSNGKDVVVQRRYQAVEKPTRVVYYVKSSASPIPTPIIRLGGIPTTTTPMIVIGDPRISNR